MRGLQTPRPAVGITVRTVMSTPDWMESAACRSIADADHLFFPPSGGDTKTNGARRICGGCPVRSECLQMALENDEAFGIFGGLSASERRRMALGRCRRCVTASTAKGDWYCADCKVIRRQETKARYDVERRRRRAA